jgi:tetratricopeptide (TPR) repeat protein
MKNSFLKKKCVAERWGLRSKINRLDLIFLGRLNFRVAIFAFLIAFTSCTPPTPLNEKRAEVITFESDLVNENYLLKSSTERLDYLIFLANLRYTNTEEFETWLVERLEKLFEQNEPFDADKIRSLDYTFYEAQLWGAARLTAYHILYSRHAQAYQTASGVAAAVLSYEYNNRENRDSLAKYVEVLENGIKEDTAQWLKVSLLTQKGTLSDFTGDYYQSIVYKTKAIQMCPPEDKENIFTLHKNIALTYVRMRFYDRAKYHADKGLSILGEENLREVDWDVFATIYSNTGDYQESEKLYDRLLQFSEQSNQKLMQAQTLANFGNLKRKQKNFNEALLLMAKSDSICSELGLNIGYVINWINRAELYYDQNLYEKALTELNKSFDLVSKFNSPNISMEYYDLSYKILDKLGDTTQSNQSFRKYTEFKSEYLGDLPRSLMTEWEAENQRQELLAEANLLNLSLEKEVKNKYLIGFILTLILLILTIAYFLNNRRLILEREQFHLQRQEMKFELEMNAKKLLSESINNINVQQVKEETVDRFKEVIEKLSLKEQKKFSNLLKSLDSNKNFDHFQEFDTRFTGVYEAFYQNLMALSSDLSPNELRVCALIRLNLSSKEIAQLTGKTSRTIENTRFAIRKKLNLDSDENLQQFLMGI